MNLENIDVFVEVVDTKSFSRAARRLALPTSTVSAKIARLEQKLGTTLIHRTTRQLNVTDAGQKYYRFCVQALAAMSQAEQALHEVETAPTGTLRLTVPVDIANGLLAPILKAYLAQYQNVNVDLIVTNRQVDLIAENIDLAIRVGPLADSSLVARRFIDIDAGLWASESYIQKFGMPESVSELSQHEQVALNQFSEQLSEQLFEQFLEQKPKSNNYKPSHFMANSARLQTDDILTSRECILAGLGIGVLPNFVAQASALPIIRVLPEFTTKSQSAYFVYPSQRFVPKNVKAFIDVALELASN